ncbi:MAG: protein meaA, partial [Leptospiraceae bacterium]|nr:protein meaA [Leptospiraceae bacterium]
ISILSGSHKEIAEQIKEELIHYKAFDHIPVIFGGIIPESDFDTLKSIGVKEIFTPKDFDLMQIMDKIIDLIAKQKKAA